MWGTGLGRRGGGQRGTGGRWNKVGGGGEVKKGLLDHNFCCTSDPIQATVRVYDIVQHRKAMFTLPLHGNSFSAIK